jgi:hypothetical protein
MTLPYGVMLGAFIGYGKRDQNQIVPQLSPARAQDIRPVDLSVEPADHYRIQETAVIDDTLLLQRCVLSTIIPQWWTVYLIVYAASGDALPNDSLIFNTTGCEIVAEHWKA